MAMKRYTRESVERALDVHFKGKWEKSPRILGGYVLHSDGIGDVVFRTLAEAYACVVGAAEASRKRQVS